MEPQQLSGLLTSSLLCHHKNSASYHFVGDSCLHGARKYHFGEVWGGRPDTMVLKRSEPAALDLPGDFPWPLGERRTVCAVHQSEGIVAEWSS